MSKPVLIIKNVSHEGPGLLEKMLHEHAVAYDIVDLNAGDEFPSVKNYAALIVMGGSDSANDDTEKMTAELARIREAMEIGLPYFGVCLGLQTLVKAAGGTVRKNDVREVAFRDDEQNFFTADVTPEGSDDPLMKDVPAVLPMFHLHGETVDLTPQMTLLASGKWCANQIVRVAPKMYGMQGHLELTDTMFEEWCAKDAWLTEKDSAQLLDDWGERKEVLQGTLRTLFANFLRIAGLAG